MSIEFGRLQCCKHVVIHLIHIACLFGTNEHPCDDDVVVVAAAAVVSE